MQDYIRSLHSVTVRHYVPNLVCVQLPTQAFSVIAFQKLIRLVILGYWVCWHLNYISHVSDLEIRSELGIFLLQRGSSAA